MNQKSIEAIRRLRLHDETVVTPGCCETAKNAMIAAALSADPDAEVAVLEHRCPDGSVGHYAILVNNVFVNISPTAMFPEYIGPLETAHPVFRSMSRRPPIRGKDF